MCNKDETLHFGLRVEKNNSLKNRKNIDLKDFSIPDELSRLSFKKVPEFKWMYSIFNEVQLIEIEKKVVERIVVGFGNHSIYETSMAYHHTYGIPYLPGSSIKGCFKSYMSQIEMEDKDPLIDFIFGNDSDKYGHQGNVIFFDSFPSEGNVVKDIINPHYDYQNLDFSDSIEPVPITFLALEKPKFLFRMVVNYNYDSLKKDLKDKLLKRFGNDISLKKEIVYRFNEMLIYHGVGAKSSVGYGYFENETNEEVFKSINKPYKTHIKEINAVNEQLNIAEREKKIEKMTPVERFIFELNECSVDKREQFLVEYFKNIENESIEFQKCVANELKALYVTAGKYKIRKSKFKKLDKLSNRIIKIKEILNEPLL